jgi:hypothetical protein
MTVVEKYECDATGEVFNLKDSIEEYTLRFKRKNPYEFYKKTIHVSTEFLTNECGQLYPNGSKIEYIGIDTKAKEVDGMKGEFGTDQNSPIWYDQDDIILDHYQSFYTVIELVVDDALL